MVEPHIDNGDAGGSDHERRARLVRGVVFVFLPWQFSIVTVVAVMHVVFMKHGALMPMMDDRPLGCALLVGMVWGWTSASMLIWWRMKSAPVGRRALAVIALPPILTVFAGAVGCFPGGLLSQFFYNLIP